MRRQTKRVLFTALGMMLLFGVIVWAGATVLLSTERGRAWTEARVLAALRGSVAQGSSVELAGLRVVPLGTAGFDALVLRDSTGKAIISLRGLQLGFGLRELLDRELHITRLTLDRLDADVTMDSAGVLDLERMMIAADIGSSASDRPGRPWRVRIDTLTLRDGAVALTRPDSLPTLPPRRDVVHDLSVALGDSRIETDGPVATIALASVRARLDEPALPVGLTGGTIAMNGRAASLSFPVLTLGASRAAVNGRVDWSDPERDPRLALAVRADAVALAELGWVDPLVPRSGSARAALRLENGARDGEFRAVIDRFTVESSGSRIEGRLVADVGEAMALRNLDVTVDPLDFTLLRELFGDSSPPPPWDGVLRGRVRGPGGPLSALVLAESEFEFEDRRIGGARSRFRIAGTIDLEAAETVLNPLQVRIDSLDVRSAGGVTDIADALTGYLSGSVTLDGPLDDVRFRDLDLVHIDGSRPRTHVRGNGRIAEDTTRTWLEARLALDTIALASYGVAVADEPMRGTVHGTLDVSVTGDSVTLDLALSGEGADLHFIGATSMDTARLVAKGQLGVWNLDASRFLPTRELPEHKVTGRFDLGLDGGWDEPSGPVAFSLDTSSRVIGLPLREGTGALVLEPGGVRVDTLRVATDFGRINGKGRLARDPSVRDTLRFAAVLDSVAALAPLLGDSLAAAWADSLGGTLRVEGIAVGSLDTLDVRATLDGDSLHAGSFVLRQMTGELLLDGLPHATRGLATFDVVDGRAGGAILHRLSAEATVRDPTWVDASFRFVAQDTLIGSGRADIHLMGDSLEMRVDSLSARSREADWQLARPSRIVRRPDRLVVDSLLLLSRDGARFALTMRVDSAGPLDLRTQALRVPLSHARFTGLMPPRVDGLLTLDATVAGSFAAPRLQMTARLDSTRVDDREAPELTLRAAYDTAWVNLTLDGRVFQRDAFSVTAELPLDLALEARAMSERFVEKPLYLRLTAHGTPLAGFEAFSEGIRELTGGLDADVQVTGTWRELEPRGILMLREGAFVVPALGTGFRDLLMDVSFSPDSILIQRARLADERSLNDTASLEGAIVRERRGWSTDLTTVARNLRVIDDPRVAEADVSWQLWLRGPLDTLVLGGDVTVPSANLFIGRQRRRALQLEEDLVQQDVASQYAPRLAGVRLRLGNEVRLRSPEANVQLTGEVAAAGTLDEPDVRGEIFASRGTFRLDLGLLQRTFQVDSGLVRLNGPLSIPPTLDIHTSYTVRQAEREDVKIGARLSGSVESPRLTLSSGDLGTTASETEIISYLLFGAPSFALDGQSASAVRLATAALVPSLGGAAERALGARLPFLSELQVVTVAGDSPRDFTMNSFEGLLNSFALTAGTQVGTDSYLRMSGGVCRGENRAAQSLPAWFGITGEYRPRERLSAEVSLTPGSAPCNRIGTFAQIYQLGLDLYRDWRW
ncbi:MAG: translocation/assembly module TamB domain-containing protein [Gemmatimonadaceae bacterium]|nr:translocation/assembly module TamB domain-containing protein [Gemmatimonadaceae bacterium]MCW5826205.1 translocation/assembly module TamB domain-containing protein [Gemmatimonadaceae bacterium]